jgi:hypothetical protein
MAVDTLAADLNTTPRTIQRCYRALEESGHLLIKRSRGGVNQRSGRGYTNEYHMVLKAAAVATNPDRHVTLNTDATLTPVTGNLDAESQATLTARATNPDADVTQLFSSDPLPINPFYVSPSASPEEKEKEVGVGMPMSDQAPSQSTEQAPDHNQQAILEEIDRLFPEVGAGYTLPSSDASRAYLDNLGLSYSKLENMDAPEALEIIKHRALHKAQGYVLFAGVEVLETDAQELRRCGSDPRDFFADGEQGTFFDRDKAMGWLRQEKAKYQTKAPSTPDNVVGVDFTNSYPPGVRSKRPGPWPEGFKLTAEMVEMAKAHGFIKHVARIFSEFKLHYQSNGTPMADWLAA